jgi:hypothetical protein
MAITDSTTKWPLLEQLPDGPIKENLIELQGHLEQMLKARDILFTLYHHAEDIQDQTITLANETVSTLGVMIDCNVDAVFHHLNQIFNPESQAAPIGGE